MKSALVLAVLWQVVASAIVSDSRSQSIYCCPDGSAASVMTISMVTKVVKFTTSTTTRNIVGYRQAYKCEDEDSHATKRVIWQPKDRWGKNSKWQRPSDIPQLKDCPIYKEVVIPVTQYKKETIEKPEYTQACDSSELVCCEGFQKSASGECQSKETIALLEDENVKNILDLLG